MTGWLLAGVWLGAEKQAADKRKAARLEQRRATPPRPVLAWSVFAAVAVVLVIGGGPAVLPVVAGVGIAVFIHERKRRAEHGAWRAEQNAAAMPSPREARRQARAFDRAGMPESARAMRDLHAAS